MPRLSKANAPDPTALAEEYKHKEADTYKLPPIRSKEDSERLLQRPKGKRNLIHKITVEGDYSATGGEQGRLLSIPYRQTYFIDDETHKKHGAISVFKRPNGIGEKIIKKRDPRFIRFLTHHLVKCETPGHDLPTDLELFNREDLLVYINQKDLPISVHLYGRDLYSLRQAVKTCEDDEVGFLKQQEQLQERKQRQPDWDMLDELNQELIDGADQDLTKTIERTKPSSKDLEGVI